MSKNLLVVLSTAVMLLISTAVVFAEYTPYEETTGAVYTMTNAPTNNEVVVFDRNDDGILTKACSISTGGSGSGGGLDPLTSQGSIVLSRDTRWLLAVNAGSNEISVFQVLPHGLTLVDKVGSGGTMPVSIAFFHNLVYVLNAGGSPNITGFHLGYEGKLTSLDKSARSLGAGAFAQVGFDPEGETLVVTNKGNNEIVVFSVGNDGLPAMNPVISTSNGLAPFGFIFDQPGHLLVVEAGSNAVSSYNILEDGALKVISPSVANGQMASCWIAGNARGNVFTANPGSSSISAYELNVGKGSLVLLAGAAGMGTSPLDLSTTVDGRFLYAVDPGSGSIDMFKIGYDGSLTSLGAVAGGLSTFSQGIAAR